MEHKSKKQETLSRPKDRSLEAYKIWVIAAAKRLMTEAADIQFTEEEWTRYWKEYWREQSGG